MRFWTIRASLPVMKMPPPELLSLDLLSLMIFLLTIGVPGPPRMMPAPLPAAELLEITLSRISTLRVFTEEAPAIKIPPPPPERQILGPGPLRVMVFSCINGEPEELEMPPPPPSHA